MSNITIYKGSILDCEVDAIVSPSNSFLHSTFGQNGGLAGVIEREAMRPCISAQTGLYTDDRAEQLERECRSLPLIATGDAKLTSAGSLQTRNGFKGIIHVVGPIWGGGDLYESDLLGIAYMSALDRAHEAGFKSIAMPAISAGIFGVPIEIVAFEAIIAARYNNTGNLDVTFALMDDAHVEAFYENFRRR